MTGPDDYIRFCVLRWLGSGAGSAASTLGAGTILDILFLHQWGKAFTCYTTMTLLGTFVRPTFSGFIVANTSWPVQFWWTVGVEAAVIVAVILVLRETGYSRNAVTVYSAQPKSWFRSRVAAFLPGTKVMPPISTGEMLRRSTASFIIGACPVTVLAGGFLLIIFGWCVATSTLLSIFLQSPLAEGGYGFTPTQNVAFTLLRWVALIVAQIYGYSLNDRLPLMVYHRRGGVWKSEYRLHSLWIPAVILPVALGLFGASLQYHLYYMALAVATFLIYAAECSLVSFITNYVAECFVSYPAEVNAVVNFYRLIFGLFIPFFITPWQARVDTGWVYGMMAFFSVFSTGFIIVLVLRGDQLRSLSFASVRGTEESAHVAGDSDIYTRKEKA